MFRRRGVTPPADVPDLAARRAIAQAQAVYGNIAPMMRALGEGEFEFRSNPPGVFPRFIRCPGANARHTYIARPEPRRQEKTHLFCAVPASFYPADYTRSGVVERLEREGYDVKDVELQPCGCLTFTVWIRPRGSWWES